MSFADKPFLLTAIMAARLDIANAYGTPSSVVRHTKISVKPIHATDKIISAGVQTDTLSVVQAYEGEIEYAELNPDIFYIMTGKGEASSGTTPNQVADITVTGGADSLPYFGLIGEAAAAGASNRFYGLYRVMLESMPEWEISNEGKFVLNNVKFMASAFTPASRKLLKTRGNETSTAISAGLFTSWLT